jgi:putative transposase
MASPATLHDLANKHGSDKGDSVFFRNNYTALYDLLFFPLRRQRIRLLEIDLAKRQLLPDVERRQSRYPNNRAENSHRPTRRRERQMQRFKSREQAQAFLAAHAFIHGHFHPRRHLLTADAYRTVRSIGFEISHQETCARHAA